jgi:hypothetical protein
MKRYHFLPILFTVFAFACGTEAEEDEVTETVDPIIEETIDTASVEPIVEPVAEIGDDLQAILDKSDTTYSLPYNVDTNFVHAINYLERSDESALSYLNGQYLAERLLENSPTFNGEYYIKIFCELDSLKSVGAYEEYVRNLDIGMMQVADAFVEGMIQLNDQKQVLLWSINYSTYEACPFASGAAVYGTLLDNYEVINTMLLAEVSSGGDPPSWGDTNVSTEITSALEIETYWINRSGEDEGPADIIQETYATRIGESGFELDDDY